VNILVINSGSSSLKYQLIDMHGGMVLTAGMVERIGDKNAALRHQWRKSEGAMDEFAREVAAPDHRTAFLAIGAAMRETGVLHDVKHVDAIGHRVVHGGERFQAPTRIDTDVVSAIRALIPLAPLHQPHNLAPIRMLLDTLPELAQVACFDTSFHRSNPEIAQRFAIPAELHDAGVRRYGFHGLSYEYIASVLPEHDAQAAAGRAVVLHLGNGASMCALERGKSVASSMGFTAVDGLPMGTRCGAIDPGVLLYLMDERGMDARAIEKLIYQQSGLLGVSGLSSDMRTLLASDEPRARIAVDLYLYRIRRELGSLVAALGGLDALVFTAGIGENSAAIRARVLADAAWLGVKPNARANAKGGPRVSAARSRVSAWAIPTNEELMIARHTRRLLAAS